MRRVLRYIGITAFAKLGRCTFCMRTAFGSAAICWSVTAIFGVLGLSSVEAGLAALSGLLTALWLAHLTAYTIRTAEKRQSASPATDEQIDISRRTVFPALAKTFAVAAIATAIPAVARPAFAGVLAHWTPACDGLCDASVSCDSGCVCKYPENTTTGHCELDGT